MGTFLIRFSDSELGGVTVAWISGLQVFEFALFCCICRFYLIFYVCFWFVRVPSPFFYFVLVEFHSKQAQLRAPWCSFDFSCLSFFYHFVFFLSSVLPGFQISQSCITGHQSHLNDKYKNISFCFCSGTTLLWHSQQNSQQTRRRTKRRWPCFSHLQGKPSV